MFLDQWEIFEMLEYVKFFSSHNSEYAQSTDENIWKWLVSLLPSKVSPIVPSSKLLPVRAYICIIP